MSFAADLITPAVWDRRTVAGEAAQPAMCEHVRQLRLMRAYQARYILLPTGRPTGSFLDQFRRHYDPAEIARLEDERRVLEGDLLAPLAIAARDQASQRDWQSYPDRLKARFRDQPEDAFIAHLRRSPNREAHYRHFLVQSSADLLAEASASALGVIGEFGAPQSALFRILIDEFGYGAHGKKHSVLYRAAMRSFGLPEEYNACWPLFDTATLRLHNAIHYLFQNPGNFFMQVGFLLYAETAYQRSTHDHFRYLRECHPAVDARYFGEHAHIDLHHTAMVIDEVAQPLVATYGDEVGAEILAGAELTRAAFDAAGAHLLATAEAFDRAIAEDAATAGPLRFDLGAGVTPADAATLPADERLQLGGLGEVSAAAFAAFPEGCYARRFAA